MIFRNIKSRVTKITVTRKLLVEILSNFNITSIKVESFRKSYEFLLVVSSERESRNLLNHVRVNLLNFASFRYIVPTEANPDRTPLFEIDVTYSQNVLEKSISLSSSYFNFVLKTYHISSNQVLRFLRPVSLLTSFIHLVDNLHHYIYYIQNL